MNKYEAWVLILNLILRITGGCVVVAIGAYLILHDHGVAGGWTIIAGILLAGISYNKSGD